MGLDQNAYAKKNPNSKRRKDLAYWRKHNRLQGWMEQLWRDKTKDTVGDFNCTELELTAEDLDQLGRDMGNMKLPATTGFFFGDDSYGDYATSGDAETDKKFIKDARALLKKGYKIYYNCWW